jgi:hypothetical protein
MPGKDLEFKDFLGKIGNYGKGDWITAHASYRDDFEWSAFFCALVPDQIIERSLSEPSWDLQTSGNQPGFVFSFKDGKEIGTYRRISEDGCEPLVFRRSFHSMKDDYWEVSEEFRRYFNLYEDKANNKFVLIDDNGDDEEVILITETEIKIKVRLIKEFLAVKKMHLALLFDLMRFSDKSLKELSLTSHQKIVKDKETIYSIGCRDADDHFNDGRKSIGYLMGKKLITAKKDFVPQLFGDADKKYVDFIIGVDEDGSEVLHTCDENHLANYFGKNPGSPLFVTPVFFKKDVLIKYYSQPEKYSVEDGYLKCGGMWGLRMDNNHRDFTMVFLGDLGHLSYKEQQYWKHFNIATAAKISHTAWARSFEGEFADPESSDLYFKQKLSSFGEKWEKKFGWKLFKDLNKEDQHFIKSLRTPLTNEQKEFDEQVLAITKVLIDSLNEEELVKGLKIKKEEPRGIDKFEAFLLSKGMQSKTMIKFLKDLQALRSACVAHRKGSKYEKIKNTFLIGEKDLSKVFDQILIDCIRTLNTLENRLLG